MILTFLVPWIYSLGNMTIVPLTLGLLLRIIDGEKSRHGGTMAGGWTVGAGMQSPCLLSQALWVVVSRAGGHTDALVRPICPHCSQWPGRHKITIGLG